MNDKIILNNYYGYTDTKSKYRTTNESLFNIASITKTITAVGILTLKEKGMLSLDDKIEKFFDNIPPRMEKITIHQLLTHTSGLQQNYVTQNISGRDSAVKLILNDSLAFEPGTDFSYSNENYELLAAIIEILTNKSYESYIRENILMVFGMSDTYFWDEAFESNYSRIAAINKELPQNSKKRNWGFIGSDGIFSCTTDLYKFYLKVKLFPDDFQEMLFKSYFKLKSGIMIGYGWFVNNTSWGTKEYWTRGTEDFGHNAVLRWFPDDNNTVIIVCTNSGELYGPAGTANRTISDAIISLMFNKNK